MEWKCDKSEMLIQTPWIKVRKDSVRLPNGQKIDDFYAVELRNAAGVVAVTADQHIVLKKEYRYTYGKELIEIPAGTFEPDETDPFVVAKRELLEETGFVSEQWTYLGATIESSSKLTNYMHLYLATDCRKAAEQSLDATEELDVLIVPFRQAVDMVMSNEICCNSSGHAILRAEKMLGE